MITFDDIRKINKAISSNNLLRFEYYPNKTGEIIKDNRVVMPIKLFSKNGKQYLLANYYNGGSLSQKGYGIRLFFTSNIYNLQVLSSTGRVLNNFKTYSDFQILKDILNGNIE